MKGHGVSAEDVLAELRMDEWVSGAAIARRFGISRQAVNKKVAQLRRRGYVIDAAGRLGCRLRGVPS